MQSPSTSAPPPPSVESRDLFEHSIPWTESPCFASLLEKAHLSDAEKDMLRSYARDGYIVLDFPAPDIDAVATEVSRLFAVTNLETRLQRRIQDAWKTCPLVRSVASNSGILDLLRLLYRRDPIPFQTLNFPVGTQQSTHSDTLHFHSVPHRFMCGVWLALEDIDAENGPLHIYPGSHRLPVWNMHDLGLPSGQEQYAAYEAALRALIQELGLQKKQVLLKKGQVLIWAANLLHGGEPILDVHRTRLSQVTHYFFSDCLYYTPMLSDPFLGNVAYRQITNILTGQRVPNMYHGVKIDAEAIRDLPPSVSMMSGSPSKRSPFLVRTLRRLRAHLIE